MHHKFINLCGHQLLLWFASSVLIVFFITSNVLAEWVSSEGRYFIDRKTTRDEACNIALEEAKQNALKKIVGENLKSNQLEVCTDNENKSRCTLYQNTFNYVEGGYINEIKNKKEEILQSVPEKECLITIDAFVKEYEEKPDVNFTLEANLNQKPRLYDGKKISITGEVMQKSYITVLGWYPDTDKENYYQIFPNQYDKNNLVEKSFNIPSKNNTKYKLMTKFPKDFPQDETYEFFVIVASKKKLDILSKQNIIDFNKRLSRLGRSNWEMKRLGYTIMRD